MERSEQGGHRHVRIWTKATRATKHHSLFCSKGARDRHQPRNVAIKTTPDFRRQPETVTFQQAFLESMNMLNQGK
jgi:hypothetical protein